MKRLLILVAALLMVGSAFAQSGGRLFVQPNGSGFGGVGAVSSTDNDDTCDIGVTPAATLLLPYFEVDYTSTSDTAVNTTFVITNTSALPQIAHVVIWTDWSYPVLDFNIWLTGYDVQGINLRDIIAKDENGVGHIPPTGWDYDGEDDYSPVGPYSVTLNPKHTWATLTDDPNSLYPKSVKGISGISCAKLPGEIPESLMNAMQAYLSGTSSTAAGGAHGNAVGYVTVDLVAACTTGLPTDGSTYFSTYVLFDNVLIGDYQRIDPYNVEATEANGLAGGNPMVHIRAVPEGGTVGTLPYTATNVPFSFYDKYLGPEASGFRNLDRRQPLPGVWAARFINAGEQSFNTNFQIWREGYRVAATASDAKWNKSIKVTEMVVFDEHENVAELPPSPPPCQISPCPDDTTTPPTFTFPETGSYPVGTDDGYFPDGPDSTDLGGWMYLNLNAGIPGDLDTGTGTKLAEGATRPYRAESQNWVTISMTAENRMGVDFDAAWLGNGCSRNPLVHTDSSGNCVGGGTTEFGEDLCGIGPLANLQTANCWSDSTDFWTTCP